MKSAYRLARFLKPYWHWAILAPLLMVLEVAMDLMQPKMIERIVDRGIAQLDLAMVVNTGLLMVGLALIGAVGGVGCTVFSALASQGFGTDLRNTLFRRVQSLSFGNLDELETGQLITRLTNDVTQVQEVVSMMLRIMVRAPLLLVGSLIMAILTSPRLAVMLVILGPLVLAALAWVINRAYPIFSAVQHRLDDLNTVMQENLAGDGVRDDAGGDAGAQRGRGRRCLVWRHAGHLWRHEGRTAHRFCQLSYAHAPLIDVCQHAGDARRARRGVGGAHPGGDGYRSQGQEQAGCSRCLCATGSGRL
jgi:ABC-type multidrug transport system fused ATPase/permease subunit